MDTGSSSTATIQVTGEPAEALQRRGERARRQVYEVVPEGNGWAIRHDGDGLLGRRYWKSEAVELGTAHAINAGLSRVLIFRKDGSLEADHLYGAA